MADIGWKCLAAASASSSMTSKTAHEMHCYAREYPGEHGEHYALAAAMGEALLSPCAKSKRGAFIWQTPQVLEESERGREPYRAYLLAAIDAGSLDCARGHNAQPAPFSCNGFSRCRKNCGKLCVHAEQAALDRLDSTDYSQNLQMLHVKMVDGLAVPSGPPSCWQCSRAILARGIQSMWLLHEDGLRRYSAEEFHRLTLENCGLTVGAEVEGCDSTRGRISLRKCGKMWLVYIGDAEECSSADEPFARAYYAGATVMAQAVACNGMHKLECALHRLRNSTPTMKSGIESDDLLCAVVDGVVECRRATPLERLGEAGDVLATAIHLVIAEGGDPELEMAKAAAKIERRLDHVADAWASAKDAEP